jgi:hypothetical protein
MVVTSCIFSGNSAGNGGGGMYCYEPDLTLRYSTFSGNSGGPRGGGLYCPTMYTFNLGIEHCTFSDNSALDGGGVHYGCGWAVPFPQQPVVENTIIAFSTQGEAMYCDDTYQPCDPVLTCCDIYGNAGGDWVGCIQSQFGINGNIALDPLFCGRFTEDFTLCANSPCAPNYNPDCGLIGAWDVGCGPTAATPTTWGRVKSSLWRDQ